MLEKRVVAAYARSWADACAELRIVQPLKRLGMQLVPGGAASEDSNNVDDADFVLIHRDFGADNDAAVRVITRARTLGKPLILTMDDLLTDVPAGHSSYSSYSRLRFPILYTLCEVDCVITTTELLAEELRRYNPHVFVVPNSLDDHLWAVDLATPFGGNGGPTVVAYMGTATHDEDIRLVEEPLLNVLNRGNGTVVLKFFGQAPTGRLADHPRVIWKPYAADYREFVKSLQTERIDIAIAPLTDTLFNRCKSAVKFLEYGALGIPAVYSKIPPYDSAVRHGETGLLASTSDEFARCLNVLIDDLALRQTIGSCARSHVRSHHLLSQQTSAWELPFQAVLSGSVARRDREVSLPLSAFRGLAQSAREDVSEMEAREREIYSLKFKLWLAELDVQELRRVKASRAWKLLHSIWRLRRHQQAWRLTLRSLAGISPDQSASDLEASHQSLQQEAERLRELLRIYISRVAELENELSIARRGHSFGPAEKISQAELHAF